MKSRSFSESNYKAMFVGGKTFRFAINPDKPISPLEYPEFSDVKITSFCMGRCPYCFIQGTKVSTINGDKNIEEIEVGDSLFSFNEKRHSLCCSVVSQLHSRLYEGEIFIIELENGKIIECTPNHKFFVKNRGWIKAECLSEEDDLLSI